MKNYELVMKISNFIDTRVVDLEDNDGNIEQCIVVPLEKNGMRVSNNNNVYCKFFVNERTYGDGTATHYLRVKTNKKLVAKLADLGYQTPYMGLMFPSNFKTSYQSNSYFRNNSTDRVKNID